MTKIQHPRRCIFVRNLCTVYCFSDRLKWSKQPSHATVPLSRIISKTFSLIYTPYPIPHTPFFLWILQLCINLSRIWDTVLVKCIKRISLLYSVWYWQIVEVFSLFYACIHIHFPFAQHKCKICMHMQYTVVHAEFRALICTRNRFQGIYSVSLCKAGTTNTTHRFLGIDSWAPSIFTNSGSEWIPYREHCYLLQ